MPNIPPSSSLQVKPGEALGPLSLSASLYSILTTLFSNKSTFPRINISFNSDDPVSSPIFIELEANGLRLRFDGDSQRLELIEVTEFGPVGLIYNESNLSRHGPPTFRSIYKTFGPTSPGELQPATPTSPQMYILSYPGIAFKFPLPENTPIVASEKTLLNLLHKSDPPSPTTSLVIYAGSSWGEACTLLTLPRVLTTPIKNGKIRNGNDSPSPLEGDEILDFAEIFANDKVVLTFQSGMTVSLGYGVFTAQDAVTLLGPPSEVYAKSDNRLSIHNGNTRHDEIENTGPLSEAPEYFYNYFHHGLSLLFAPSQNHTLQKILLHGNIPHSYNFHRFHRLRWIFAPSSPATRKRDPSKEILTSETNFEEIKCCLEKGSSLASRPMIVNRGGQGSPSSSIELLSDDILTAMPFGCTELYGFMNEGLVFEVMEGGWVNQVTAFKA